jgi:release factor glutamine methyltransferase
MMHRVMPTAEELLRLAEEELKACSAVDHPHRGKERADAEDLLTFAVGDAVDAGAVVRPGAVRRFRRFLDRRLTGEPVAYITGSTQFAGLPLEVRRGSFIPRQSSEWVVGQAVKRLRGRADPIHVDLATGVGPIALAVASRLPEARVFGVDLSRPPLAMARRNARRLGLANVRFEQGDLFGPLPRSIRGTVDVITIHPPYIGRREVRTLPREIRTFEPMESLTDRSPLGMGLIGRVVAEAPDWLRPRGWLLIEVSPDRSRQVATVVRRGGFVDVRSTKGGIEFSRVVVGRT